MRRPSPGGPQWPPAQADDPLRRRPDRGRTAARARSPAQGRSRILLLPDSSAVFAEDQEPGGIDSLAVSQGHQHGRLQRSLAALVGPSAAGLSATTITRLKAVWEDEFQEWTKRSLEGKQYVYLWVDGVHFNIRLEEDRQCILVLMGATADGRKELIAVADGYRESEQSWKALLLDVKARGLAIDPKLAIGDGALGFWKALPQVYPTTREQRCWVHKTANVLDKLPKLTERGQGEAARDLMRRPKQRPRQPLAFRSHVPSQVRQSHRLSVEEPRRAALVLRLPGRALRHLRTTNPIESTSPRSLTASPHQRNGTRQRPQPWSSNYAIHPEALAAVRMAPSCYTDVIQEPSSIRRESKPKPPPEIRSRPNTLTRSFKFTLNTNWHSVTVSDSTSTPF